MKRLEFLQKARQIACEQIDSSSALTDEQFEVISQEKNQELALYRLAEAILDHASYDIVFTINEMEANNVME